MLLHCDFESALSSKRHTMYYLKLTLGALLFSATWIVFVFITAFYGWWMRPIAAPGDTAEFFRKATHKLEQANLGNGALVLIENGKVVHEYYTSSNHSVDQDTLFATASMSKWLTAFAAMKLVQDGLLNLDQPISDYLSRWQLPETGFASDGVTVRRLLSHTAGLTDGLGFGDYTLEEAVPTVEESLSAPRTSDGRIAEIAVTVEPGTQWIYSGGGYLILELVIEEVSGMEFSEYMHTQFFTELGMLRSTYSPINLFENNAGSYDSNGEPAPVYQYASSAATGFATTSADLSKFVMAQLMALQADPVITQDTLEAMRTPHGRTLGFDIWGLGTILYAPSKNGDFVFGHDGGNDPAINSTARINPDNNDAIIVLETGHLSLATNIGSQWVLWQTGMPDFLDSDSVIKSMTLPIIIGLLVLLSVIMYFAVITRRKH